MNRTKTTRQTTGRLVELTMGSRNEWRKWLRVHHKNSRGIWLVFRKSQEVVGSLSYNDSVEEAICFGWIDSLIRRIDHQRYARKFTPRTDAATWSAANRRRLTKMIAERKLTKSGLAVAKPERQSRTPLPPRGRDTPVPLFMQQALHENPSAREFFDELAPSHRWAYVAWVSSAKREDTRQRRLREALQLLMEQKPLGLK